MGILGHWGYLPGALQLDALHPRLLVMAAMRTHGIGVFAVGCVVGGEIWACDSDFQVAHALVDSLTAPSGLFFFSA